MKPRFRIDGFSVILYKDGSLKEVALDLLALVALFRQSDGVMLYEVGLRGDGNPTCGLREPFYSDTVPWLAVIIRKTPECPCPVAVTELFYKELEGLP